jgi:transcriptional regulator with XRE-family HTH domain
MAARHLTVPQLHHDLGGIVTERTIRRWRNGGTAPGIEALPFLARALDTTPHVLLGWEDE